METEEDVSNQDSSRTIPSLPLELITEILSRLPVKPLLQFRSVSKSWLALISSPKFVKTHLAISANNKDYTRYRLVLTQRLIDLFPAQLEYNLKDGSLSSLLINGSVTDAFDLDYPMKDPRNNAWVVGSVNGLICLAIEKKHLFFWNPSIRKFRKLPDSGSTISNSDGNHLEYGFGYDEIHDDYKVVGTFCSYRNRRLDRVEIKIYSLKSDSWRSKSDFPREMQFVRRCKFVNGKLHWANFDIGRGLLKDWKIISIDLPDEEWGTVEQPRYGEGYNVSLLGVLGSYLSVMCDYMRSHADVWVMKEYGVKESWTKMYSIKYPSECEGNLFSLLSSTLCISDRGELLLTFGSTFVVYNQQDESIRYPKVVNFHSGVAADIYIESLVCPLLQDEPEQE